MTDLLGRALAWLLALFAPCGGGRHSAKYLNNHRAAEPVPVPVPTPDPAPVPESPWARPWTSPSAADVRAIFRDERTLALPALQRERVWAAAFAELGVDYDHPAAPLDSLVTPTRAAA